MAALADRHPVEVIDLRTVSPDRLEPLLADETRLWREHMRWDFAPAADLVRHYVSTGSLNGFALAERSLSSRNIIGYGYFVYEGHKALIGDLYVVDRAATRENEYLLLNAVLDELKSTPAVRRVECQLMMLRHSPNVESNLNRFPGADTMQTFSRRFMAAPARVLDMSTAQARGSFAVHPWTEAMHEDSARLISHAYNGHIDSQINDQYRTAGGARRFVANIVQYPGCGKFFAEGSLAAIDLSTGALCGICLTSIVAEGVGHVTQICVAPWAQGQGIGRELLRCSFKALVAAGCEQVSLTVTTANEPAVRLYESMGFRVIRTFSANVWELG